MRFQLVLLCQFVISFQSQLHGIRTGLDSFAGMCLGTLRASASSAGLVQQHSASEYALLEKDLNPRQWLHRIYWLLAGVSERN